MNLVQGDHYVFTPTHAGTLFIACLDLVCANLVPAQPTPAKARAAQTATTNDKVAGALFSTRSDLEKGMAPAH
jgi:hypothetical protein